MAKKIKAEIEIKGIGQIEAANKEFQKAGDSAKKFGATAEASSKQAAKGADALGVSVGKAVAQYASFAAVAGFLKSSIDAAGKLERGMAGLQAITNQAGASFEDAKDNIKKLAEDGIVGIGDLTDVYKQLLQQGISSEKAFQFIGAAKRVSTFKGTLGDTSAELKSFTKALLSGEEGAENLDPSIKATIRSLGGMEKVAGNTNLKLQLLNKVIADGALLNKDYDASLNSINGKQASLSVAFESLQQAVGGKLAGSFKASAGAGSAFLNFLTKNIDALAKITDVGVKSIPIIGSIYSGIESLYSLFGDTPQNILEGQLDQLDLINDKIAAGTETQDDKLKKLELEKKLVGDLPEAYQKTFEQVKKGTNDIAEQARELLKLKESAAANVVYEKKVRSRQAEGPLLPGASPFEFDAAAAAAELVKGGSGGGTGPKSSDFLLNDLQRQLAANKKAQEEFNVSIEGYGNAAAQASAAAKKLTLDTLAVQQAQDRVSAFYETSLNNELLSAKRAAEEAQRINQEAYNAGKKDLEKFNADKDRINKKAQRNELDIKLRAAAETGQALAQVNAAALNLIQAQGRGQTTTALGGVAGGLGAVGTSAGGAAAGLGSAGLGLGIAGIGLGIAGAIFTAIDDADAEEKRRAKERREREEREKDRASQIEIARIKTISALNKINFDLSTRIAELAKQARDYELELLNLGAKSQTEIIQNQIANAKTDKGEAIATLAQGGISSAGVGIQSGFSNTGTGADKINSAQVVLERQEKAKAIRAKANALLQEFSANPKGGRAFEIAKELYNLAQSTQGTGLLTTDEFFSLRQIYLNWNRKDERLRGQQAAAAVGTLEAGAAQSEQFIGAANTFLESNVAIQEGKQGLAVQKFKDQIAAVDVQAEYAAQSGQTFDKAGALGPIFEAIKSALGISDFTNVSQELIDSFGTEGVQYEQFQLLLGLNEQIKDATKKTAENTAPSTLGERQRTFFDVGRGGVVNADKRFSLGFENYQLTAPSGVQSVALASGIATQSTLDPQLVELNSTAKMQLAELQKIAARLSSDGGGNVGKTVRKEVAYLKRNGV